MAQQMDVVGGTSLESAVGLVELLLGERGETLSDSVRRMFAEVILLARLEREHSNEQKKELEVADEEAKRLVRRLAAAEAHVRDLVGALTDLQAANGRAAAALSAAAATMHAKHNG